MKFSRRITPIKPSPTMAVTSKAKAMKAAGVDVLSFGAGEPDFDTPDFIVEALIQAVRAGKTRYTPASGIPALRDAVAEEFSKLYGVPFERGNIIVSVGGKHALYNIFQVLVDPGDEVIIPSPFWVSYPDQVKLAEGEPVFVETDPERGFELDVDAVAAAITGRTVGMVINSPSNPSGAVLSPETLGALGDLAEKHDLWIVSDDIYSYLRYVGEEFASVLRERPNLRDRIVVVHGASKTFAMTGWRIGFTGASKPLISKLSILQSQSTSNPTAFAQYGALAAVQSDMAFLTDWLAAYDARRVAITKGLNAIDGVTCNLPGGAFYVFPDIRGLLGRSYRGESIDTDFRFAELLLEHAKVAVVPGEPFGAPGFVRLSYACSMADIDKGLERIAGFVAELD